MTRRDRRIEILSDNSVTSNEKGVAKTQQPLLNLVAGLGFEPRTFGL